MPEPVTESSATPSLLGAAHESAPRGLFSASFCGLLATQFLGAMNDNIFRLLAIGIGTDYVLDNQSSSVVAAGLACFTLPYLLLAAPAGYLADRFSKRHVIVLCKVAEIVIMALAVGAILSQQLYLIFLVLALMGGQSALFGPSKLGSIPEMLPPEKISSANGLMGLVTVVATVTGVVAGNELYALTGDKGLIDTWISALALVGTAVVGTLTSLFIVRLPAANTALKFPRNPALQTLRDLQTLASNRALLRVALGIAFFWSLGALAQSNILELARESGLEQFQTSPLMAALVIGVGLGSVLAGVWSAGRVELGILPLGAGGVALSSMLLFTIDGNLAAADASWSGSFLLAGFFLFLLGTSAGLFDIPLNAYMQHRSPPQQRGVILAACNFLTFAGMLLSAGVYYLLRSPVGVEQTPLFSARQVFLLAGLFTIPVFLYIVCLLPQASIRFVVWLASKTAYRVRVYGHENLPERGGALLVCNHVTWIDGILLLMASSRPIRLLAHADYITSWPVRWLARLWGVIPITPGNKSVRHSLEKAQQALRNGELVCIFPGGPFPHGADAGIQAGIAVVGARDRRARNSGLPG
jgi:acyl-[acyl-carrier-protein]-phospholipid O-acyltransferase/long-chain-fatty-acid--[acyl-carrier-protein] ligase